MSLVGQKLGEFEILERLGQGGMGTVYKARQLSLKRIVALKTLRAVVADDEAYIARFQQEAVAAARLSHPNLVQVYSAGESDGLHWFSMEYVEGESAKARLNREGRIEPLEALGIAIQVATALQYGWRKASLIHRDVKPDNIFLSQDGEVKLGDLGLAKSAGENNGLTTTGHSMGSPYYISPEQVQDMKTVDCRADIYSLGCTLFQLISGKPPFDGSSGATIMLKHITEPVPIVKAQWPECPQVLSDVIEKMMQKDPATRQQDHETVISELRQASARLRDHDAPTTAAPKTKPQANVAPPANRALPRPSPVIADREALTEDVTQPTPHATPVETSRPPSRAVSPTHISKVRTSPKTATPQKSKVPIVVEIITALLMVAALIYFFMASGKKTSPTAPDDSGVVNTSNPWRDWVLESRRHGYFLEYPDSFTDNQSEIIFQRRVTANSNDSFRNGKIRVRCTIPPPNSPLENVQFYVRMGRDPKGVLRRYEASLTRKTVVFATNDASQNFHEITHWSRPSTPDSPLSLVLEIEARNNSFTISLDKKKLGTIQDDTIPAAGTFGVDGPAGTHLTNLSFIIFDAPEPPSNLPATN
jgi:serine/threonine protein kinase